jgi:hypothetical protein
MLPSICGVVSAIRPPINRLHPGLAGSEQHLLDDLYLCKTLELSVYMNSLLKYMSAHPNASPS